MDVQVYLDLISCISRAQALDLATREYFPRRETRPRENPARSNFDETGHRIPPLARASGRKTGVGHGTVPPEPRRGMAGNGAAEVRRVPGSLIKSPPALTLGGTLRSDPVPDPPESLQRPRAHTRRASANANARAHSAGPAYGKGRHGEVRYS